VHNDIKPANMVLAADGKVKLIDLGLVSYTDEDVNHKFGSSVFGTAVFLSPERLNGAHPSPTDDTYALGISLYYAVTGRYPYNDERSDVPNDYFGSVQKDIQENEAQGKTPTLPSEILKKQGIILPSDIAGKLDLTLLAAIDPKLESRLNSDEAL